MTSPSARIVCEILAPDAILATALGRIADICAYDTGQPVSLRTLPFSAAEPAITLRLPVELAATQHPVWCLACRLACFCPEVRISVLILGENSFAPKPKRISRRSA